MAVGSGVCSTKARHKKTGRKNMKLKRIWVLSLAIILGTSLSATAQTTAVERHPVLMPDGKGQRSVVEFLEAKLQSKLMAREMPYRIILPKDYAASKAHYPVVFLLHGLSGHYTNWIDKTKLADYAAEHQFIIVTPEGNDGWYTDSVSVVSDKYESYIIKELIPEIDKNYRTIADREHRMIAGLSMGGYGGMKFGLKY